MARPFPRALLRGAGAAADPHFTLVRDLRVAAKPFELSRIANARHGEQAEEMGIGIARRVLRDFATDDQPRKCFALVFWEREIRSVEGGLIKLALMRARVLVDIRLVKDGDAQGRRVGAVVSGEIGRDRDGGGHTVPSGSTDCVAMSRSRCASG